MAFLRPNDSSGGVRKMVAAKPIGVETNGDVDEFAEFGGLFDVGIHAGFERFEDFVFIDRTGEHHDDEFAKVRFGANGPEDLKAVEARHVVVEQENRWKRKFGAIGISAGAAQVIERFPAVGREVERKIKAGPLEGAL